MLSDPVQDDGSDDARSSSERSSAVVAEGSLEASSSSLAESLGFRALDLQLLQSATYFDMSSRQGRKDSNEALSALFLRLHGLVRPDVVLEIGAREAAFSCRVRRHAPDAKIYAFEANPHNYERFRTQPGLVQAGVEYIHLAVSNGPGEVSFFISKAREGKTISPTAGSHSMLERLGNVDETRISVPATSVAAFVKEHELSGTFSAWIDVEGAIRNVFMGMATSLANFAMILCEVEEHAHWKEQWLWPDVVRFMSERGFVPIARDFEQLTQHNVIFLRADWFARAEVRYMLAKHYSALGRPALQRGQEEPTASEPAAIASVPSGR